MSNHNWKTLLDAMSKPQSVRTVATPTGHIDPVIEALRQRDEAIEVLKAVEWKGQIPHHDTCPFCEGWKKEGHKPNCKLAKAIDK